MVVDVLPWRTAKLTVEFQRERFPPPTLPRTERDSPAQPLLKGTTMDMNRAEGGLKETVGRLQDAAGALAGDARAQLDGKGRQFAGQAQGAYGEALDGLRDAFDRNPLTALLAVVGFGFLAGLLVSRR